MEYIQGHILLLLVQKELNLDVIFSFSGSEPRLPVDAEAIRLGREALMMLDDAQSSRRTLEVVEVLLMGMGYVLAICVPAAVVCFFIYICR